MANFDGDGVIRSLDWEKGRNRTFRKLEMLGLVIILLRRILLLRILRPDWMGFCVYRVLTEVCIDDHVKYFLALMQLRISIIGDRF